MSSEVICSLIAAASATASALISFFISRSTVTREIKKMKLEWAREDAITNDSDFESLFQCVYDFTTCENDHFRIPAMAKLAAIRAKETGSLAPLLDELQTALSTCNRNRCERLLSEIVIHLRHTKSKGKHCKGKKPS